MVKGLYNTPNRNLYLDSCIYIHAWDTEDPYNRVCLASKQIITFFRKQIFTPYVSEMVVRELSKYFHLSYSGTLTKISDELKLGNNFKVIKTNYRMKSEANRFLREYYLHYPDNIHAGIAKVLNCILVTKDRFLLNVTKRDGLDSIKPEEFAFARKSLRNRGGFRIDAERPLKKWREKRDVP